jgi:hypothetical protein
VTALSSNRCGQRTGRPAGLTCEAIAASTIPTPPPHRAPMVTFAVYCKVAGR